MPVTERDRTPDLKRRSDPKAWAYGGAAIAADTTNSAIAATDSSIVGAKATDDATTVDVIAGVDATATAGNSAVITAVTSTSESTVDSVSGAADSASDSTDSTTSAPGFVASGADSVAPDSAAGFLPLPVPPAYPLQLVPAKHRAQVSNPYNGARRSVLARAYAPRPTPVPHLLNSYLRPNAVYIGEQQLSSSKYHIKVEFKTIDLANSLVTGFLQINGLTDDNPVITTCFRGEIINNPVHTHRGPRTPLARRFSFRTENPLWGSYFENDLDHWRKLTGSYDLNDAQLKAKLARIQDGTEASNLIYMRWKEEFLLPDSRVKQIANASFEGFYYIVLNIDGGANTTPHAHASSFSSNIIPGSISGLYYHKTNDKFQSLSLRYVNSQNYSNTFEFA